MQIEYFLNSIFVYDAISKTRITMFVFKAFFWTTSNDFTFF